MKAIPTNRGLRRAWPAETGVIVVLILLTVWLAGNFPDFRQGANLNVILSSIAEIGIVAAGMTLVISSGGIDISVGSVVGLCSIVFGKMTVERHWGLGSAIFVTLIAGSACGAINGFLIARCQLPPIIATLAMLTAARAAAYTMSGGSSISPLPERITDYGYGNFLGIPTIAWTAVVVLILCGVFLRKTSAGRSLLALGGGRQASWLSGLPIKRVEWWVYVVSGLLAGLAAVVVTAKQATADPNSGKFFEMRAITAVVVGGTPVIGGRATILGTALGVLTIGIVQNGVTLYGHDAMVEMLVTAIVLLAAVEVDRIRTIRAARPAKLTSDVKDDGTKGVSNEG